MKKMLTLVVAFSMLSFAGFSQGRGKGNGKAKKPHTSYNKKMDRDDDRWDDRRDRKDDRYRGKKTSKNVPAKVRRSFNRDFPNANNVTWTKDRGYWTAHFGSGIFGRSNTVTYHANGSRVNSNNGIFRSERDRTVQTRDRDVPVRKKRTPLDILTGKN